MYHGIIMALLTPPVLESMPCGECDTTDCVALCVKSVTPLTV